MSHILWEWTGSDEDTLIGYDTTSGTGQSGGMALTTAQGTVLNKAKSMALTQQTSSGNGLVYWASYLPIWTGVTKKRATITFTPPGTDANFDFFQFTFREFDGSKYWDYSIKWDSNFGATEEIQYINSSGVWTDTGFNYPADETTNRWYELQIDIDIVDHLYTFIRLNNQSIQSNIDVYGPANGSFPTSNFILWLDGSTSAVQVNVDSLRLEDIT